MRTITNIFKNMRVIAISGQSKGYVDCHGDQTYLHSLSVLWNVQDILQHPMDRLAIVVLQLRIHALSPHFYTHKHMHKFLGQVLNEWMVIE